MDPTPLRRREALAAGFSRSALAAAPWKRPHYGVVAPDHLDDSDPLTRIRQILPIMTGSTVLTGWAAARWQGVRYFDGVGRDGNPLPITLASPDGVGQHRHRRGIRSIRRRMLADEWTLSEGARVATIARATYDAALDAVGLRETVVAIDTGISRVSESARTTLANLARLVERHHKTRGIVRVRRALDLASERSASPWESRVRMVAVLDADLKRLAVNAPVFASDGGLLGVADLIDPATGLVIESDGSHHREAAQHRADNQREERFERAGLVVCRFSALDLQDRVAMVDRIRAAAFDAARRRSRDWTLTTPGWWSTWDPGRRWD